MARARKSSIPNPVTPGPAAAAAEGDAAPVSFAQGWEALLREGLPEADSEKREAILHMAAECFGEKGFSGTSLEEIARRVGLHKATLYHYVASKDDILYMCLIRSFKDYGSALQQLEDHSIPCLDRLRYFFRQFVQAQNNLYGRCVSAVGTEALGHEPGSRIRTFRRHLDHAVRALLEEGIARGEIRPSPVPVVSAAIFGAFTWISKWHQPGRGISLDTVCEEFLRIFIDGLSTHPDTWVPAAHPAAACAHFGDAVLPEPQDKLGEILHAAARCFIESGYEATSLVDIAARVNLHKATLYHYIRSKNELLMKCHEMAFAEIDDIDAYMQDATRSPRERFEYFFRRLIQAQNSIFGRCLNLIGPQPLDEASAARFRSFQHRLDVIARDLIKEGIACGDLQPAHPVVAAAFLFGSTNWVLHWFKPGRRIGLQDISEEFLRIFCCGVRARPA